MVDLFALVITHALLALTVWRLVQRDDLDQDPPVAEADPPAEAPAPSKVRLRA